MIIKAPHPSIDQPNTYLTASAAAAATALTVANNAQFAANDYIILGKFGQEGTELKKISTVSGNATINTVGSALKFAASVNTAVTYIKYNQVKFYLGDWSARYATGTITATKGSAVITGAGTSWGSIDTTYALLLNGKWYDLKSKDSATQITLTEAYQDETISVASYALVAFASQATVDIAADQLATLWDDTDAIAEDYYRTEYYNATSTAVSTKSSIVSAAEQEGFSEYSVQALQDEVLSELQDYEAKRRSREEITNDLNDAQRMLMNTVLGVREDYLNTLDYLDLTTNGEETLFTDFRRVDTVWISYDGSTYKKARHMKISDDTPSMVYYQNSPYYYLRDNMLGVKPVPTATVTNGAKVWYQRRIPSLKNQGDEIPYALRDVKHLYKAHALSVACRVDDKSKSIEYSLMFANGQREMANTLKGRDESTNKTVEDVQDLD